MSIVSDIFNWVAGQRLKASRLNEALNNLKTSINATYTLIGDLSTLTTTAKSTVVGAINEVDGIVGTAIQKDGSISLTGILSYANASLGSLDLSNVANSAKIPDCKAINDAINAKQTGIKEYGLTLAHSGGNITVSAGQRYASDNSTPLVYAGGTLTVGTLASANPATRYYIFLGLDTNGDEVLEKSTSSAGVGLSTITGAKCIIGEFYAQVSSTSIDTTILTTYNPDGSKIYAYTQASGNFPNADVTITHNLGTKNILSLAKVVRLSDSDEFNLMTGQSYALDPVHIESDNAITIDKFYTFLFSDGDAVVDPSGSASYRLKVIIKTL